MQSHWHEHDYSIHFTIFLPPIALRETKSIYNVVHVLSTFSNMIDKSQEQKQKKKERKKEYHQTTSVLYKVRCNSVILNNTQISNDVH